MFTTQSDKASVIAFYNMENLFDTINTPGIYDTEFTPAGSKRWTGDKYWEKINNMATAISKIGEKDGVPGPAILGVCEIENRSVLEDLVKAEPLKDLNMKIVHYNSPDKRGIDVALLYQPRYFKVTHSSSVPLMITKNGGRRVYTRDQLVVSGIFNGEEMHFVVNHWPSRRSGKSKSRPQRNAAADLSRSIVDSIIAINPNAKVVVMGDFNDEPMNESVNIHLKAVGNKNKLKEGDMYNTMYKLYKNGIGSLTYHHNWILFDQIIITQPFLDGDDSTYKFKAAHVFNDNMLVNRWGKYKGYLHRTYVGDSYKAGYSDHFPVYILIFKEEEE